jgi:putative ABC transport system permease protein
MVLHSIRSLTRFKLRSVFMMLGSIVGVATLTLVVSVGQAAERKMFTTVRRLFGASSIVIVDGGGRMMGGPRGAAAHLKVDDIEALAKELPGIQTWDPQQVLPDATVRCGGASETARVLGESERSEQVWNRGVTHGEYFDEAAVTGSARVALIGETVAKELFGNQDPLGAEFQIESVSFRVVGILEPWGTDPHGMDRDNEIVVPVSTLMRRLTNVDTIASAQLLINDPRRAEETANEMKGILRGRHALAEGQPDDFTIITPVEVQKMVGKVQRVLFLYLPLVAGVSLVVGGIVSASLMLVSVNSRVAEIGLRRAVGASAEDIWTQFLIETAATTLCGGIVGILLGYLGAQAAANRMHLGNSLSWSAVLLGLAASVLTGLAAGLAPARRAARLLPAVALR